MKQIGLPPWLKDRVFAYYDFAHEYEHVCGADTELDTFLNELSPSLQIDVKLSLFRSLISKIPFFSNPAISNNMVEDLVVRMTTVLYLPGDTIIRKVWFCVVVGIPRPYSRMTVPCRANEQIGSVLWGRQAV